MRKVLDGFGERVDGDLTDFLERVVFFRVFVVTKGDTCEGTSIDLSFLDVLFFTSVTLLSVVNNVATAGGVSVLSSPCLLTVLFLRVLTTRGDVAGLTLTCAGVFLAATRDDDFFDATGDFGMLSSTEGGIFTRVFFAVALLFLVVTRAGEESTLSSMELPLPYKKENSSCTSHEFTHPIK